MPRINNLSTDTTIRDNDYLIGYDGESGNSAKKYKLEELQEFFNGSSLDGFNTGRILAVVNDDFIESVYKTSSTRQVLLDGDGDEEDNSIIATSSQVLQVGSAIASVVFAQTMSDGDFIVIENSSGTRDFGVIGSVDSDDETITFRTGEGLEDYTNFTSSRGYANTVTLYQNGEAEIDTDVRVTGDLTVEGDLLDSEGNEIIQSNPVTLSGNNTFTGTNTFNSHQVTISEGLRINDGDPGHYIFPVLSTDPADDTVLTFDSSDNEIKFKTVGELIPFGTAADTVATWAEGNNTDDIPADKLPDPTATEKGVVRAGTNIGILNGVISATGSVGTFNVEDESTNVATAATTLNFIGGDVTAELDTNDSTKVNVTYTPGNVQFGTDSTEVAVWAKGDDTSTIPLAKLSDATSSAKGIASFGTGLSVSDGAVTVANTIPTLSGDNSFTGENTFSVATGAVINLRRNDSTPVDNDSLGIINHEGYSLETESYQDFAHIESRYKSNTDYEYGQYRINTNYVTKSDDTFSTLTALTLDRYGLTADVDTTLNQNVTIGTTSTNTLTINATTTFEEPIVGSTTQVVNNRDNTQNLNVWLGTQAQYQTLVDNDDVDANTIYYTT